MIEVRIRSEGQSKASRLCYVPFDQVDTVMPRLSEWGFDEGMFELSGQFVVEDHAAYFEIIVHDES